MLKHNLLLIFRNFKRNKSSFVINLIGLSTGLACALLIYLWVSDELSIDKFNEKDSQLFQVLRNVPNGDGSIDTHETTPVLLAQTMKEELPEVEYAVSVIPHWNETGILSAGDKHIRALPMWVSEDYFNVFSYRLIQGDKSSVFSDKNAVLLSDKLALKLFHTTTNMIGKTVEWDQGRLSGIYTISGIFEAPPSNASDQFDLLFSSRLYIETYEPLYNLTDWGSNNPGTYVILRKGTNIRQFNDKIKDFISLKYKALYGTKELQWIGEMFLRHYSDQHLYDRYEDGVQAGGRIEYVRLFSMIAIFILIIACVNFMNLSTAKATGKLREIGVKKTIGAGRRMLILQYLEESMLISFLSLLTALLLVVLFLPQFNEITGKHLVLYFDTPFILSSIGLTLFTGIISGSYPAFYLSRFNPAVVMKGKLRHDINEFWVRKGLVIFQFTISVILIVSVMVVYKQIEFVHTKNLGYNKDHIIHFSNEGKLRQGLQTFLSEVRKIPGVVNASSMDGDLVGNHSGGSGISWEGQAPGQAIEFDGLDVDYDLIGTLNLELVEGRSFSRDFGSDSSKVIFNETAIAAMGIKDPIGKTVTLWGKEKQIIGVIKDFHFESLYKKVGPFFFRYSPNNGNVLVKIKAGMEKEVIANLQKFYQQYNQGLPFEYNFLDNDYEKLYASEQRVNILSRYFAGFAILISCLGLFGLAAFTAERRTKEIGVRKVLGSSAAEIAGLLSGDFTKLVIIATGIALPAAYLISHRWLESFAYRIDLKWWYFAGAGLVTLLIAWLSVGMQTMKAALVNPAECLKEE